MEIENNDAERNAARGLAELSEEMIMEILLRLPAMKLVSLKSVCTSWRNLISSPEFTRNHFRRSCLRDPTLTPPQIAYYTYKNRDGVIESFSVQSMLDNPSEPTKVACFSRGLNYRLIGSCHGLLCFFDHDNCCENTHGILWNPCTGFKFQSPKISGLPILSGFGYDNLSDSYKFVGILRKEGTAFEYSTRSYTFGQTSSWRRIDEIPFALFENPHAVVNREGLFFCSNRACTINWSLLYDNVIVYFVLGKETYGHFSLPAAVRNSDDDKQITDLCVLRNCLSVCCYELTDWIVWQMTEYGDVQSWTKLAIIPSHRHLDYAIHQNYRLQPLYILESDVLLAISPSYKIVLCNLNNGSIDCPAIDSSDGGKRFYISLSFGSGSRMAYIYHESLVSPNGLQSNSSEMLLRCIKPKPRRIIS